MFGGYGGYFGNGAGMPGASGSGRALTPEALKCMIEDLEWQLKGRLSELEQQIAEVREACGVVAGAGYGRGGQRGGKGGAYGNSYGDPWFGDAKILPAWSEGNYSDDGSQYEDYAEDKNITEEFLEEHEGHVFEGSVWDSSVFIGTNCLGFAVSLSLALLIFTNMVVQSLFCYLIYKYMLDDPVGPETLNGLLRFRTSEAHSALYADRVRERSLASQVCDLDAGLHWATSQVAFLRDVRNARQVGQMLCLLATTCWLATLLKEVMDTVHFTRALALRLGRRTLLIHSGDEVVLQKISVIRFFFVFVAIVVPRLTIAGFLLPIGMSYLRYTISPSELMLNSMALTFIIQIDEMFYEAFAPRRVKCLMRKLQPMRVPSMGRRCGHKLGGLFSTFRLVALAAGIAVSYVFLLQPFYANIKTAEDILCSGDRDFIYSVNPSTQVVEATRSNDVDAWSLSESQRAVLELAHPHIRKWRPDFVPILDAHLRHYHEITFPSPERFRTGSFDSHAFKRIVSSVQDDVVRASRSLVCEDWDKMERSVGMHVAARRIAAETHGSHRSCSEVNLKCADMNSNAIRALCPMTCGCAHVDRPPAGFFASPAWGCPMRCYDRITISMAQFTAPMCSDVAPEEFATDSFLQNYIRGFYSYFLSLMESGGVSVSLKMEVEYLVDKLHIKPDEVNQTVSRILDSGSFLEDIITGRWQFAPGVPHPRGLTGCKFWTSWEVAMLFGTDLCAIKGFRSIRMFCPQSCGCKKEAKECPITCPMR